MIKVFEAKLAPQANNRIAIIDIGSNSIRLVIYELSPDKAYRVIDEGKVSARLSGKISEDGVMEPLGVQTVIDVLNQFKLLCTAHQASSIRAVATAAIRNASNQKEIVSQVYEATGLSIEVLSGEEEARYGYLGMIYTMDIRDGFLIDIGGGSTEVSLIIGRRLLHSISIPYGSVNVSKRFARHGEMSDTDVLHIRRTITEALESEPWVRSNPGLPLVGLGGTIRCVCKIHQRQRKYSMPTPHNYDMQTDDVNALLDKLFAMPVDKRKKVDGLSADRVDIIVPGLVILSTICQLTEASHYQVCASGLRDGLFYEILHANRNPPHLTDISHASATNLLALNPYMNLSHVKQVQRIALTLFDAMNKGTPDASDPWRRYLSIAALLYRIGISVHFHDFRQHTFYQIAFSRIDGLSHREIILCALIASFKTKSRARQLSLPYKDLLHETDLTMVYKLGVLLNAAIAMDRSETQPIQALSARIEPSELLLFCGFRHSPELELRHLKEAAKDFAKEWGFNLRIETVETSR
jgi:exopolyphosphatase / guanosine-5'-triphosphate,3'-diphosphate pyrophosphatase